MAADGSTEGFGPLCCSLRKVVVVVSGLERQGVVRCGLARLQLQTASRRATVLPAALFKGVVFGLIGLGKVRFGKAGWGTVKVADGSTEGSCPPCRPQSGFGVGRLGVARCGELGLGVLRIVKMGPQGPSSMYSSLTRPKPHHCFKTMLKPQSKTDLIKRFIHDAGPSIISVEFTKLDGTVRKLQFNPLDSQEIKGTGHALKKPNIVRCRDFAVARKEGAGAWRSFDCELVVKIQAHGTIISF